MANGTQIIEPKVKLGMLLIKARTFIALFILFIVFSILSPTFLMSNTLLMIAKHVALYGILAIGMTYVIITGGIDLSVGAVVALVGMIAGGLIVEGVVIKPLGIVLFPKVWVIVVICILIGVLVGLINGLFITKFKVAPFIATLGMMYVSSGFAALRSGGSTFSRLNGSELLGNTGFAIFGSSTFGVPNAAIILFVFALIAAFVLKKLPFGWHLYSTGGNEKAARFAGIRVTQVKMKAYVISGVCASVVGIITASQLQAANPNNGTGWEMNAIAAVVLGGTSMSGGVGTIGGTIIGAFVIGVLNDGMVMCGVSEYWQKIIKGLVIIFAVIIDMYQKRLQEKL
ncbi:ABC transporter permease [uncultured Sphaerochaeta sp.]|uniref:ABC transporter permease n=1 Tax=uncultured Sphaerochaeta sp. TaxID=886478 RepID=UPI002A0A8095|nr:ABC transporter permease [uncultured Sphaerochaeta sp.]